MKMYELGEFIKDMGRLLYTFFSHRILWLTVITVILFYVLLVQLFELQIIRAEEWRVAPVTTTTITRSIPPLRGTIYDRHGRPLAINESMFVLKIDPSVDITNEALLALQLLLERNGENYIDDFPISREEPFEFTFTGTESRQRWLEHRWKDDLQIPNPHYATAQESWEFLREERFNIDPELSNDDARRIMNFRSQMFMQRLLNWNTYNPTPIMFAYDVSPATIAAVTEMNSFFAGVSVEIETRRYYPAGRYMSHIIGYVLQITAQQYEANRQYGYTQEDLFGRTGIELWAEHLLRGTPGEQTIQVNRQGRRVGEPTRTQEPEPGGRVFLTIDLALQQEIFYVVEDALSTILINRLNTTSGINALSVETAFENFTRGYNLDIRAVLAAEPDNLAYPMRRYILDRYPNATTTWESMRHSNTIVIDGIRAGRISAAKMLSTLIGTGQITDPYGTIAPRLATGSRAVAREVLIQKIHERELTPQLMNTDPFSASVIVTDPYTGQVLAAVTYPTYDNNRLVNVFDSEYFHRINALDPTRPMMNRPFREAIAPGSTFKMFTAVAGLAEGVIAPHSRITSSGAFHGAGHPPLHCWHRGGHGSLNVIEAIAVSCNVFFAEVAHRLGFIDGRTANSTLEGIGRLNDYMAFFGLNDFSGVEIGNWPIDLRWQGFEGDTMASPDLRRFRAHQVNPFPPLYEVSWRLSETVRVAIGQGINQYSAAQMVRAMGTIATRGRNYELHLVSHIENFHGGIIFETTPTILETDIVVSDSTWDTVIEGMRQVSQPATRVGTGATLFRTFPVTIAGKTGTAEQIDTRFSHTSFGAFAPLDNPQVAIYVNVPFGSTTAYSQASARIARTVLTDLLGLNIEPERPEGFNVLR